nr:MAG TPA: hypothetical protein [Caudoviricetes sp.]
MTTINMSRAILLNVYNPLIQLRGLHLITPYKNAIGNSALHELPFNIIISTSLKHVSDNVIS